jgi:hypothetical protein
MSVGFEPGVEGHRCRACGYGFSKSAHGECCLFDDLEDAKWAYAAASLKYHGAFGRWAA